MGILVRLYDNANRKRAVEIEFSSTRRAEKFIESFQHFGGIRNFDYDFVEETRPRDGCKGSLALFIILRECLYSEKYAWVTHIWRNPKTHILLLNNARAYPSRQMIYDNLNYAYEN